MRDAARMPAETTTAFNYGAEYFLLHMMERHGGKVQARLMLDSEIELADEMAAAGLLSKADGIYSFLS